MKKLKLFVSLSAAFLLLLFPQASKLGAEPLKCGGCKTEYFIVKKLNDAFKTKSGEVHQPARIGNKKAIELLAEGKFNYAFTCKSHNKLVKKFKIPAEKSGGWSSVKIAKDPIVLVVNPGAGITDISKENINKIFMGKVKNWKEVGGKDLPIKVAYLDSSVESGTVTVFTEVTVGMGKQMIPSDKKMRSPEALGNFCKQVPGVVTFMGLKSYKDEFGVKVKVDGKEATPENVKNDSYPLFVTYFLVFDKASEKILKPFMDFVKSDEGQKIINQDMVAVN